MNSNLCRAALGGLLMLASATIAAQALDPAASPDTVVATRGGVSVTLADVDTKLRTLPADLRSGYLTDPERISRFLDTLLTAKQLAAAAEKEGLTQKPTFAADLELARQELLSRQIVENHMESVKQPNFEQLAHEQYLASPDAYKSKPRIDIRHILITTDGKDEEAAQRLIEEARQRALAGEDFSKLVMEYSDEKSKETRQGLIQNADLANLDPAFGAKVAKLRKVGDISEPARSQFGYHIIKLERYDPPQLSSFDAVKFEIIKELRTQFLNSERSRFMAAYAQQPTELNNELIKSLPTRYAPKQP